MFLPLLLTGSGSLSQGMVINVYPNRIRASAVLGLGRHGDNSICHVSVWVTLVQLMPAVLLHSQMQVSPLLFGFKRKLCLHHFPAVLSEISLLSYIRNVLGFACVLYVPLNLYICRI